jgi:hypothetical protein
MREFISLCYYYYMAKKHYRLYYRHFENHTRKVFHHDMFQYYMDKHRMMK